MSVLRWFGHMKRMEVKRIIRSDVRGLRLIGRPQMRLMDVLKSVK